MEIFPLTTSNLRLNVSSDVVQTSLHLLTEYMNIFHSFLSSFFRDIPTDARGRRSREKEGIVTIISYHLIVSSPPVRGDEPALLLRCFPDKIEAYTGCGMW